MRRFKNTRRQVSLNNIESTIRIPEDFFPSVNETRLILFLESTGKKCMDLLRAFYYERLSTRDLLNRFGYKTEHSATVQKYKCIEKVRETIKQKSMTYEDFFE